MPLRGATGHYWSLCEHDRLTTATAHRTRKRYHDDHGDGLLWVFPDVQTGVADHDGNEASEENRSHPYSIPAHLGWHDRRTIVVNTAAMAKPRTLTQGVIGRSGTPSKKREMATASRRLIDQPAACCGAISSRNTPVVPFSSVHVQGKPMSDWTWKMVFPTIASAGTKRTIEAYPAGGSSTGEPSPTPPDQCLLQEGRFWVRAYAAKLHVLDCPSTMVQSL